MAERDLDDEQAETLWRAEHAQLQLKIDHLTAETLHLQQRVEDTKWAYSAGTRVGARTERARILDALKFMSCTCAATIRALPMEVTDEDA
jgi:hypothetical protein